MELTPKNPIFVRLTVLAMLASMSCGCGSPHVFSFKDLHRPFASISRHMAARIGPDECQTYCEPGSFGFEPAGDHLFVHENTRSRHVLICPDPGDFMEDDPHTVPNLAIPEPRLRPPTPTRHQPSTSPISLPLLSIDLESSVPSPSDETKVMPAFRFAPAGKDAEVISVISNDNAKFDTAEFDSTHGDVAVVTKVFPPKRRRQGQVHTERATSGARRPCEPASSRRTIAKTKQTTPADAAQKTTLPLDVQLPSVPVAMPRAKQAIRSSPSTPRSRSISTKKATTELAAIPIKQITESNGSVMARATIPTKPLDRPRPFENADRDAGTEPRKPQVIDHSGGVTEPTAVPSAFQLDPRPLSAMKVIDTHGAALKFITEEGQPDPSPKLPATEVSTIRFR